MATARGEFKAAQWALLILAVLASALIVGVLARVVDRDTGTRDVARRDGGSTSISSNDGVGTSAAELEPTLALFPQRASIGRPLELLAQGEGCRAGGGVLSIYRLADVGRDIEPARLVVRQPITVRTSGAWQATPLLAEPLPGSYRVSMTCDRVDQLDVALRVDGDGPVDPVGRRDQLTVSNVLVVSGPATAGPAVDLIPRLGPTLPSVVTVPTDEREPVDDEEVVIQGFDCDGRIEGRIVSSEDGTVLATFRAVPDSSGDWEIRVTLPAADAASRYRVDADCLADDSTPDRTTTSTTSRAPTSTTIRPSPVTTEPEYNG